MITKHWLVNPNETTLLGFLNQAKENWLHQDISYRLYDSHIAGGVKKTITSKLSWRSSEGLFNSIPRTTNLTEIVELVDMCNDQLTLDIFVNIFRSIEGVQIIKEEVFDKIKQHNVVFVSSELGTLITESPEFHFKQQSEMFKNKTFFCFEELGKCVNTTVIVMPYLPHNTCMAFDGPLLNYDLSVIEEGQKLEAIVNINPNISKYIVSDFDINFSL